MEYLLFFIMKVMNEEWRPILDFPQYQVSNLGRVKSMIGNEKLLSQKMEVNGYLRVCLKHKCFKNIHRLVAEAFIPNPDNKCDVDHIDRNRANNVVDNLRWATRSENCLNTKNHYTEDYAIRKVKNRFIVRLRIQGKHKQLGSFITKQEAVDRRDLFLSNKNIE